MLAEDCKDRKDSMSQGHKVFKFNLETFKYLQARNSVGMGIFVSVNRTDGKGKKIENITDVRACIIDGDDIPLPDKFELEPSMQCSRSETRWHAYWLLKEGEDLNKWVKVQKALIAHYGTDRQIHNLDRVIRMPGFNNCKKGERHMHNLDSCKPELRYTLDEIIEAHGFTLKEDTAIEFPVGFSKLSPAKRLVLEGKIKNLKDCQGDRHNSIGGWIIDAVGAGMDPEEVYTTMKTWTDEIGLSAERDTDKEILDWIRGADRKLKDGSASIDERLEDVTSNIRMCSNLMEVYALRGLHTLQEEELMSVKTYLNDKFPEDFKEDRLNEAILQSRIRRVRLSKGDRIVNKATDSYELAQKYCRDSKPIVFHMEYFWSYAHGTYVKNEDPMIRDSMHKWLADLYFVDKGQVMKVRSEPAKVDNVLKALSAHKGNGRYELNEWIGEDRPKVLNFSNGLLDLESRELHRHSDKWFSNLQLEFAYNGDMECINWLKCLDEWFEGDGERIKLSQLMFAYVLSGRIDFEVFFQLIGVGGAGKSTMLRVLGDLIGPEAVSSKKLMDLGKNFGLSSLIGKRLCLIPDAHSTRAGDMLQSTEAIKSISGGDTMHIDMKYKESKDHLLNCIIVMASNTIQNFGDTSDGIMRRARVLNFNKSFQSRVDTGLKAKLHAELPGICNWALDGLEELKGLKGVFPQASAGVESLEVMRELGSPEHSFITDYCTVGAGKRVKIKDMFRVWCRWRTEENRQPTSTTAMVRSLTGYAPGTIKRSKNIWCGEAKKMFKYLEGIDIKPEGLEIQVDSGLASESCKDF
jgi:P4 family phage/plasmid primase-like protien